MSLLANGEYEPKLGEEKKLEYSSNFIFYCFALVVKQTFSYDHVSFIRHQTSNPNSQWIRGVKVIATPQTT